MIQKKMYSKLPYFIRKRFSQKQTFKLVLLLAVSGSCFLVFQVILLLRMNSQTEHNGNTHPKAADRINTNLKTFDNTIRRSKFLGSKILGVKSENLKLYVPDAAQMFACIKTGQKINFTQVNDDYCDCLDDGSDEPSTGACPNTFFACQDENEKLILSSRVNDMICDCCDGSDEWSNEQENPELHRLSVEVQVKLQRFQTPCSPRCG